MPDIVSPKDRSRMMAGIRGKNTQSELAVRKGLHARGFRYRIHDGRLPGKPDMSFPHFRAVIEINGCFWHLHTCHLFRCASTRKDFWQKKLSGNKKRDAQNHKALKKAGWRALTIWECALKGCTRRPLEDVIDKAGQWLELNEGNMEIEGMRQITVKAGAK